MQILKDFFIYAVTFDSIAAGDTETENIQIQADADFEVQKLSYFADVGGAGQTITTQVVPLATVVITDSGSGRQLMNEAIAIGGLFGDGRIPFILPTPRVFAARSNVTFQVVNFDAAQTYRLRLNLIGTKLFQVGR